MMVHLYTGILRLSELVSEGQTFFQLDFEYHQAIVYGQRGESVTLLQYLLSILAQFYLTIPFLTIDGVFGDETQAAVQALQLDAGLPQTGTVDEETWDVIIDQFIGIDRTVLSNPKFFPYQSPSSGEVEPELLHSYFSARPGQFLAFPWNWGPVTMTKKGANHEHLTSPCFFPGAGQYPAGDAAYHRLCEPFPPFLRPTGRFDEETLEAVMMFQKDKRFPGDWYRRPANLGRYHERLLQAYSHLAPPLHCHHFFPRCGTDPPHKVLPYSVLPRYVPCIG